MTALTRLMRWTLAALAMALVVWSFFDVGQRTIKSYAGRSDAGVTLTVLHWGTPEEEQIIQDMIDAFEAEHPGVEVQRIHAAAYDAKLKTMLAAGTPPDLFYLKPDWVGDFAESGMLLDLEPFVDDERAKGQADWLDDFYPELTNAYRWDASAGRTGEGGRLVGLPKDFTPAVMYINVDLFRAAGYSDAQLDAIFRDGWTWTQYRQAMRRIAQLSPSDQPSEKIFGGTIKHWGDPMRNLFWSFGASVAGGEDGEDFTQLQLTSEQALACMRFIRELRFEDESVLNPSGLSQNDDDLFIRGRIGCLGPYGRWFTPKLQDVGFEWDVVPVPHAEGVEPSSFLFSVAWAVSSQTEHPDESFALLKSLTDKAGQARTAESGLALPASRSVAKSPAFLDSGMGPTHAHVFLDSAEIGRLPHFPRLPQFNRIFESQMKQTLVLDATTPRQAADNVEALWANELESPLYSKPYPKMPWGKVVGITSACLLLALGVMVFSARREQLGTVSAAEQRTGWLFISPWVAGFLMLVIGPIVLALLLSLTKWSAMAPLSEARFVGLDNYRHMAKHDPEYTHSLGVTVYFTLLAVPTTQVAALLIAVLMNAKVRGIELWRTIYFLPSVVTGVALVTLWIALFDNDNGAINATLNAVGLPAPDWFGQDGKYFAIPAIVIMSLWGVGGGMVIYLAGLKNIPAPLYEAARIDGAGPARQFFNITLPMLSPLIFFNLVMGIIGSFQVFTQAYVITNSTGGNNEDLLVYVLNLYRHAFEFHNMGYASALAWVLFLILVALTALVFKGSKNMVHYEGLR
ncbi:MAG: extracellular solute-binding protein [Phycisphaeraceae bacterium]